MIKNKPFYFMLHTFKKITLIMMVLMDFKTPQKTNPQHFINKAEKEQILSSHDTIKIDDKHRGTHIKPYLSVAICDNLIYQNVYLQTWTIGANFKDKE